MKDNIVLASASPRRKELLAQMGLDFEIVPSKGEEVITKEQPDEVVIELASQKAREVAAGFGDGTLIIGADTVVVKDGKILGKPADEDDAVRMLKMLQGTSHQVYTGVCLIKKEDGEEREKCFFEATDVDFYPMSREEILAYVRTGEPMDKAGAYGIQGKCAVYIRGIRGDYNNVVGLPIARLYHEMVKTGCMEMK